MLSKEKASLNIAAWCAAIHGVAKSWTRLSDWPELNWAVDVKERKKCSNSKGLKSHFCDPWFKFRRYSWSRYSFVLIDSMSSWSLWAKDLAVMASFLTDWWSYSYEVLKTVAAPHMKNKDVPRHILKPSEWKSTFSCFCCPHPLWPWEQSFHFSPSVVTSEIVAPLPSVNFLLLHPNQNNIL